MRTAIEISVRKTFQGAFELTAIYKGEYLRCQYFGYSIRDAKRCFRLNFLTK